MQNCVVYFQEKEMQWDYTHIESVEITKEIREPKLNSCLKNFSTSVANADNEKDIYTDFVERMVLPALEKDDSGSIAILCRTNEELTKFNKHWI